LAATRVYILAEELGVKSTAIVKKCQDEGLDVKNHMSAISAGLTATICEWFSEGEHTTTVEVAEKVDLTKARVKKKAKRKPAVKKTKEEKEDKKAEPAEKKVIADQTDQTEPDQAVAVVTEEPEPEPILPAGPMLEKPEPAKLSGPQVVRVEEPEPVRQHKPKRRMPRTRYDEPITEPLIPFEQKEASSTKAPVKDKKQLPKRHKDRTHGRRQEDQVKDVRHAGTKFVSQRHQILLPPQKLLRVSGRQKLL